MTHFELLGWGSYNGQPQVLPDSHSTYVQEMHSRVKGGGWAVVGFDTIWDAWEFRLHSTGPVDVATA
jgi:hypothetical protein